MTLQGGNSVTCILCRPSALALGLAISIGSCHQFYQSYQNEAIIIIHFPITAASREPCRAILLVNLFGQIKGSLGVPHIWLSAMIRPSNTPIPQ